MEVAEIVEGSPADDAGVRGGDLLIALDDPPVEGVEDVQRLMAELESHPDPAVRTAVASLLQGIDAVHRTALTHLVGAIQGLADS